MTIYNHPDDVAVKAEHITDRMAKRSRSGVPRSFHAINHDDATKIVSVWNSMQSQDEPPWITADYNEDIWVDPTISPASVTDARRRSESTSEGALP